MTPIAWVAAGGVLASLLAFGGGTAVGIGLGEDKEYAKRAREESIVAKVGEAAQVGAALAIAKNRPRNVTIRQEIEREIQTRTLYRDCRHAPDGVRLINEALTGRADTADAGQLPGADATR